VRERDRQNSEAGFQQVCIYQIRSRSEREQQEAGGEDTNTGAGGGIKWKVGDRVEALWKGRVRQAQEAIAGGNGSGWGEQGRRTLEESVCEYFEGVIVSVNSDCTYGVKFDDGEVQYIYAYTHICICICICIFMHIYMNICIYVCMYACMYVYIYLPRSSRNNAETML
jgi:hypothetical protein